MKKCMSPRNSPAVFEQGLTIISSNTNALQRLQPPSLSLGALSTNPKFRPDLGKILRTTVQRKVEVHQIKKMRGGIVPKSHLFACGFSHVELIHCSWCRST